MRFAELTAVRRVDDDTFTADVDPTSFIVRGPNGGFLAAVLLRAMVERVDDPGRAARSLTVHYLAPPVAGPVTIETDVVRRGRSMASLTARMDQGGRPMALALAAFSTPWPGPSFADEGAPAAPPFDDVAPRDNGFAPPFLGYWDQRITIGPPFGGVAERADTGGWLRLREPEPVDAIVVAAMADAWMPAIFVRVPDPAPVPTIDLTVHFRRTLPHTDMDAASPVLVRFRTRHSAEGMIEEDGELWAPDGTLLAQSRQLAITAPASMQAPLPTRPGP